MNATSEGADANGIRPTGWIPVALRAADVTVLLLTCFALGVLALRAMLRLELRWDTVWYHLPFAAVRGGLRIPFEMNEFVRARFEGFPPLPHLVEGLLWRITGSVNATGTINYAAFAVFLFFCHRKIGARVRVVAMVALTAPMVLIHVTTSYVDLFGNSFLAVGATCIAAMFLLDRWEDSRLLVWGLSGLVCAAWSKFQLVPIVALFLVFLFAVFGLRRRQFWTRMISYVAFASVIAAAPYIKNLILYHNPFWPVRLPVASNLFPFSENPQVMNAGERPRSLMHASQFRLFFTSLLELHHPTSYPDRERWIIDQGNASEAFRAGGFWNVGVVTALATMSALALVFDRRKAWILMSASLVTLCIVAVLPQSHELRYYQFLPLTWAAIIGVLIERIRRERPPIALVATLLLLSEFAYVSRINRSYYKIERVGYHEAAEFWQVPRWWRQMQAGATYCSVRLVPRGILLTGPTMSEFHIIDRLEENHCPPGVRIITPEGPRY